MEIFRESTSKLYGMLGFHFLMKIPLSFSAILLALTGFLASSHAAGRPNVVLFLVDDMGWMDSSVYGSEYYETPNMERLATQSMRFTDAYAVPLCSPTRASILSGQYTSRHGVTSASGHQAPAKPGDSPYPAKASPNSQFIYAKSKNYLDPKIVTIAEVLKSAGYRTGHFGKWHLGLMPQNWPETQGFEETWHCAPDPGPPSYFSPYHVSPDGTPGNKNHVGNITDGPEGEYITDRLTTEAIKFIDEHKDEPFFLNLWQYGVHGPWGHKESYTKYFAEKKDPRGEQGNPIMASMLKSVDDSLGRIMDRLDQLNLTNDTLFIFYSDNGGNTHSNTPDSKEMTRVKPGHPKYPMVEDWKKWAGPRPPTNNFPLREGKGRIYEGGQRVPLMVRWPGHIAAGTLTDTVVGPFDLYPTILDALNLQKPKGHIVDGTSFLPVLEQTGTLDREAIFTWFPHLIPAVSVRSGDWKLIRRWEPHPLYPAVRELYNLKEDISESNNLAEKMPDKVAELDALIDGFIADTKPLVPQPNPAYKAPGSPEKGLTMQQVEDQLKARMCKYALKDGALQVNVTGPTPFLGTARVRFAGPVSIEMKVKGPAGEARVDWKTVDQKGFPEDQSAKYSIPDADGFQTVSFNLPTDDILATTRLYLPSNKGATYEIQSLRFSNGKGQAQAWDFTKEK